MSKPRDVETSEGIQDRFTVEMHDEMKKTLRDRGWMETKCHNQIGHRSWASSRNRSWSRIFGVGMVEKNQ